MPRKMRAAKARRYHGADWLNPEVREVLLLGWGAPMPPDIPDDHNPFAIFDLSDDDLRTLWVQHRAALLADWHRRGQRGPCWAADQFDHTDPPDDSIPAAETQP